MWSTFFPETSTTVGGSNRRIDGILVTEKYVLGDSTMKEESLTNLLLTLVRGEAGGRVTVPLDTFLEYDLEMTHDLEELVDRWSDMAAPIARRARMHRGNGSYRCGTD